jgi:hypothetical protein
MASVSATQQEAPRADDATEAEPSPEQILQVAMGFWASKTLLSAVEMQLFSHLTRPSRGLAIHWGVGAASAIGARFPGRTCRAQAPEPH